MRAMIGCGVVLLSALGNVTEAAGVNAAVLAEIRGLSPIISVDVNPLQRVEINNLLAENVVVADAGSTAAPSASFGQKYDAAFSVCGAAVPTTHRDYPNANQLTPLSVIDVYLFEKGIPYDSNRPVIVTVLENPVHGTVVPDTDFPDTAFVYHPNEGYLGPDQITFIVEEMGKKFKVIETVWVANTAPEYGGCPADYKLPPATTGNEKGSALDVIELPVDGTIDTDALAKLHAFVNFAAGASLAGVGGTLSIADLQGAAVKIGDYGSRLPD